LPRPTKDHLSKDTPFRSSASRAFASRRTSSGSPIPTTARRLRPRSEPPFSFRKDQILHASAQTELQSFTVDVEFSSGGEPYVTETYKVEASDWYRAQRDALKMSVSSPYDNVRIPDLTRRVIAR
jgi:hypothetical protein